jgi:DNA-binding IclR family transcriptional regulator
MTATGRTPEAAKVTVGGPGPEPAGRERAPDGEAAVRRTPNGEAARRTTTGDLLALVEELATFDRIGVTRLSRHLGVPVATAYRMLRVLERAGYVEQLRESKEYRLTLKLFELGCQVASRTTMRDVAAVEIERLAEQTGAAAQVGVLVDDCVLYLGKVETDDLLTLSLRPGSRAPATCTAMGKAMLAADTRPVRSIVGDGPYAARTDHSITCYDALVAELAEVQRRGYAVDRQELSLGLWCVAAPIMGSRQAQAGAVSIASYGVALDEDDCARFGKLVIACAGRIARRIGSLEDMHSWIVTRTSYPRP